MGFFSCCLPKGLLKKNVSSDGHENDPLLTPPSTPIKQATRSSSSSSSASNSTTDLPSKISLSLGGGVATRLSDVHQATPIRTLRRLPASDLIDGPAASPSSHLSEIAVSPTSTPTPLSPQNKESINGSGCIQTSTSPPTVVATPPFTFLSIPSEISSAISSPINSNSTSPSSSLTQPASTTSPCISQIIAVSSSAASVPTSTLSDAPRDSTNTPPSSSSPASTTSNSLGSDAISASLTPPPIAVVLAISQPSILSLSPSTIVQQPASTSSLPLLPPPSQLEASIVSSISLQSQSLPSSLISSANSSAESNTASSVNANGSLSSSSCSLFQPPAPRHVSPTHHDEQAAVPAPSQPKPLSTVNGAARPTTMKEALKSGYGRIIAPGHVVSPVQLSAVSCLIEMYNQCVVLVIGESPQSEKVYLASEYKNSIRKLMRQLCDEKLGTEQKFGISELLQSDDFLKLKAQFSMVAVPKIDGQPSGAIVNPLSWDSFGGDNITKNNSLLSVSVNRGRITDKIRFVIGCGYCVHDGELCKKYRTLAVTCGIDLNAKKPAASIANNNDSIVPSFSGNSH